MNKFSLFTLLFTLFVTLPALGEEPLNNNLEYGLAKPLLIIKEKHGFLACAYINPDTCDKTGEACAIVSGVNSHADMKTAKVIAISKAALNLGINIGDSGEEALNKLK
jgi:uncharacterized protein YunC (DUF1805 family)